MVFLASLQYSFGLICSDDRSLLDFFRCTAADGVIQDSERVVGHAHHSGNVSRRNDEGLSAEYHCTLATLFKGNAIMQTAR